MKTFVISLKNSNDRRNFISSQAQKHSVNFSFIDAIKGKDIPENLYSLLKKQYSYAVTQGEVGCSLSHLAAYKKLIESNEDFALILEDDVMIPEDIEKISKKLGESLPNNKACVCLLSKVHSYNKRGQVLFKGVSVHEVFNAAYSHAYIINKKAATVLLDKLLPIWCVADQWPTFKEFGYINLLGVIPACVHVHPKFGGVTTIEERYDIETKEDKAIAWNEIRAARPLSIRIKKMFFLLFYRPFQKIIKQ